jgi:hypothetical protein
VNYKGLGLRVSFIYDVKLRSSFVTADILYGVQKLDNPLGCSPSRPNTAQATGLWAGSPPATSPLPPPAPHRQRSHHAQPIPQPPKPGR